MKTCKRCFREFGEEEVLDVSPTTELADIMLQDIGKNRDSALFQIPRND